MRTVVEELDVEAYVRKCSSSNFKFEKVWDALIWKVARGPEKGQEVDSEKWIMVSNDKVKNFPTISIVYTFGEERVNIFGVKMWGDNSSLDIIDPAPKLNGEGASPSYN